MEKMKLSLDIEETLVMDVKALTGQTTQAGALRNALRDWVRRTKLERLKKKVAESPLEFDLEADELRAINRDRGT